MTEPLKHQPWRTKEAPKGGGAQQLYRFPNGYGVSLIPAGRQDDQRGLALLGVDARSSHEWPIIPPPEEGADVFGPDGTDVFGVELVKDILTKVSQFPARKV